MNWQALSLFCCALTLASPPVWGEPLEEIIVTARKRAENLQVVPISVTAFTGEVLETRGVTSLADLNALAPNLGWQPTPVGGSSSSAFFIRGIGQFDYIATADQSVGLYLDGVYVGRSVGALLDVVDVEHIEILRGPQGTLFGRNTPAGAVQVISRKPTIESIEGEASVAAGSYNPVDAKLAINVPLSDRAAFRLTAASLNRDGHGTSLVTGQDLGAADTRVFRGQFLWNPGEAVEVLLSGAYTKRDGSAGTLKAVAINDADPFINIYNLMLIGQGLTPISDDAFVAAGRYDSWKGARSFDDNEVAGATATVTWNVNDALTLKSITAQSSMSNDTIEDFDGTPYPFVSQEVYTDADQFSQEFQLSGTSFDGRLTWIGGLFLFREDVVQDLDAELFSGVRRTGPGAFDFVSDPAVDGLPVPVPPFSFVNNLNQRTLMDQSTRSWAVFGEGTLAFSDTWSLTAGLRYSVDDKELTQGVQPLHGPVTVGDDWSALTPRVALTWQANERVMAFLSASRGFRSGGFNGRETSAPIPSSYDPEYLWSYEAGLKSDWLGDRLRVNLTGFYYDYTDRQGTVLRPDQSITVGNVGKAELYGLELEAIAALSERLRVDLGLGLLEQEITEVRADGGGIPGLSLDSELENAPRVTGNLGLQYEFPLGGNGSLTLRGDLRYKGAHQFMLPNYPGERQSGYTLVDTRIAWESPENLWSVQAFGTNVFDREYAAFAFSAMGFGFDLLLRNYGRPAEFGVIVERRF